MGAARRLAARGARGVSGRQQLAGLVRDAFAGGSWQAAISLADLAQIALITHFLGLTEYGRFALAIALVTLVVRVFDLRVAPVVVSFGAQKARDDMRSAAGVFQFGYAVDGISGVAAFLVIAAVAPFAGPALVGDHGTLLVLLYALSLLVSTLDESSGSVLRLLDRFGVVAVSGVALEILRVGLVAVALVLFEDIAWVLGALILYQSVGAVVRLAAAASAFRRATAGGGLFRPALASVRDDRRAMLRMLVHTNVVSYARLTQTQLPTILVGALAGPAGAGVYKIGTGAAALLGRLADPLYLATLPRLSRLWAEGRKHDIQRLLRSSTLLSGAVMVTGVLLLVVFRDAIVSALGGEGATAATTVLAIAAVAHAVNGTLFWNVSLLYAMGRPEAVTRVALLGVVAQVGLLAILVPPFAATGAAVAFLVSIVLTNALATASCLRMASGPGPQLGGVAVGAPD